MTSDISQAKRSFVLTYSERSDVWHWIDHFKVKYSSYPDRSLDGTEDLVFWAIYRNARDYLNHGISLRVAWKCLWEIRVPRDIPPQHPG